MESINYLTKKDIDNQETFNSPISIDKIQYFTKEDIERHNKITPPDYYSYEDIKKYVDSITNRIKKND